MNKISNFIEKENFMLKHLSDKSGYWFEKHIKTFLGKFTFIIDKRCYLIEIEGISIFSKRKETQLLFKFKRFSNFESIYKKIKKLK